MIYKDESAAKRDGWVFDVRGDEIVASRYSGLTRLHFVGPTAADVLSKINKRAAHRASMGHTTEPVPPSLKSL